MLITRRKFIVGTATLSFGVSAAEVSFATGKGVTLNLRNPKGLAGLSGEALRTGLLGLVSLASGAGEVLPARLYGERVV